MTSAAPLTVAVAPSEDQATQAHLTALLSSAQVTLIECAPRLSLREFCASPEARQAHAVVHACRKPFAIDFEPAAPLVMAALELTRDDVVRAAQTGTECVSLREPVGALVLAIETGHARFEHRERIRRRHARSLIDQACTATAVTASASLLTGLAHELNNPLAVVLANLEETTRLVSNLGGGPAATELAAISEETWTAAQRIERLVRDLRMFARTSGRIERVDVNAILEGCVRLMFAEIRHRATLSTYLEASLAVQGTSALVAHALVQVLLNAAQALPDGQVDEHSIRIRTRDVNFEAVEIEIANDGSPVPTTDAWNSFDAFVSTKRNHGGMGLTLARAIIHAHGGTVDLCFEPPNTSLLRIQLPASEVLFTPMAPPVTFAR